MKILKLLIIIGLVTSVTMIQAQQISGTQVTSPIVPNDLQDDYPTHVDSLGFGGYRVVPNLTARSNIKSSRKVVGMLVYVISENKIYQLSVLPDTWIELELGSLLYPEAGIPVSTGTSWGNSIIDNSNNWNTAYSWGDHSTQGYITASSIDILTNKSGSNSQWTNDEGYITSYTENDPVYTSSQASNITVTDITNLGNLSGVNTGDQDLSALSLKSNVLELDNLTSFTPDADYEPATKKYVDDVSGLSPLTTKGDLWAYSNQDARLPAGNDGQILLAASYLDEGLKWSDQVEQSSLLKSKLNIGENNTSLWLISPKAHYYNGNIYFCYNDYTANTRKVAKYDYTTGVWASTTWTQSSLLSTGATSQNRAHAAPTIFMDSDGYIHITYGGYQANYIRTVRSTNPDDISSFEAEVTIENTPSIAASSYPTIFQKGSTLICIYRGGDADSPVISRAISADNGDTWTNVIDITADYPYLQSRIDKNGRVHIAFHLKPSDNQNLYYLYSDDIENVSPTFKDITGTTVTIPATNSDALVFNSSIYDQCYLLGMDADNASNPHIFAYLSDATEANRLSYFSYRNSAWVEDTIELGNFSSWTVGAVQGDVQFKNDSSLYLMSEYIKNPNYGTYGKAEIKEWVSYDYGATWNFNQFITENTETTVANPLYVRESGEPMWFEGSNDYGIGKSVHIGYSPNSRFTSPVVYNSLPVAPNQTPTKDYQLATKKYVDDNAGGGGSLPIGSQGDMLYHNGTDWTTLGPGTSGEYLKTLGTGANPIWDTPAGGSSLWTSATNGIYYNSGNVSIGNTSPNATFDLVIGDGTQTTSTGRADFLISNAGLADFGIKNSTNNIEFSFTAATSGVNAVTRTGTYLLFQTLDAGSYVGMDAESGIDEIVAYDDEVTINTVLHLTPRASAPASPIKGTIYVNGSDNHIYFYNGTAWVQLDN